jgi:pimeloyl-ACP methyl ester carboxylesterase
VTEHEDVAAERVRRVVLVATAAAQVGLGRGELADRVAVRLLGGRGLDRAMRNRRAGHVLVRGALGAAPVLSHLHAVRDTYVACEPETRAGFFTAMSSMDLTEGLRDVAIPTVVVVGSHDRLTPVASARRIVEHVADARLEVVDGAGHMLPTEVPDRLVELLEEGA